MEICLFFYLKLVEYGEPDKTMAGSGACYIFSWSYSQNVLLSVAAMAHLLKTEFCAQITERNPQTPE